MLWPVVADGRLERLGYIFLGSWFLEQLRHEAGVYIDWDVLRDLPPIARKLYGLLENDRFEEGEDGEEWQAYWLGPPLFASVGSTCARERDNVAAVARACEAIAGHPAPATASRASGWPSRAAWCSSWWSGAAGRQRGAWARAASRAPPRLSAPRRPRRRGRRAPPSGRMRACSCRHRALQQA